MPLYHGRMRIAVIVLALFTLVIPAHASPTDPDGDDWVSIALSPVNGGAGFGMAGNHDQAVQIAMDECLQRSDGTRCVTADTMEYGCVAFALDPTSRSWAGGRGPDKDSAITDAVAKVPGQQPQAGGMCSIPATP